MQLFLSKPAIPWAPERIKVSLIHWSSILWSSCRCSTWREPGRCWCCWCCVTGKVQEESAPSELLKLQYKHISRFRTHSPGCVSVISNRKGHFFNPPCSKERAAAAWWNRNQWSDCLLEHSSLWGVRLTEPPWACFSCQPLHCYVGDGPTFQDEAICFAKVACIFAKGTSVYFLRWGIAALQLNNKRKPKSSALFVIKMMLAWKQRTALCESWSVWK